MEDNNQMQEPLQYTSSGTEHVLPIMILIQDVFISWYLNQLSQA